MARRYGDNYDAGWASSWGPDHSAHIFHPDTHEMLKNLGKLESPEKSATWPQNNPSLLRAAICSARTAMAQLGYAAATALAPSRPPSPVEEYMGQVKEVRGDQVIAGIGPIDDIDGWDVILQRNHFKGEVRKDQEFKCTIFRYGSHADIDVEILDSSRPREMEDFGIDKAEWLEWASQVDLCLKPLSRSSSSADD